MFRLLFSHPQVLLKGRKLQEAVRTFGIPNVFTLNHKQFICVGVSPYAYEYVVQLDYMFRLLFSHTQVLLKGCKLQEAVRTLESKCVYIKT